MRKNKNNVQKLNKVPPQGTKRVVTESGRKSGGAGVGEYSYGTRRVNNHTPNTSSNANKAKKANVNLSDADKRRMIEKKRKEERLKRERMRALIGLCAVAVVTIIVVFMTPLFHIKEIHLNGNYTVPKETITAKVGDLVGANLFGTSESKIEKRMSEIPQIQSVRVEKHVFPAYLELFIEERRPAAYFLSGNTNVVVDSDLQVIDDTGVFPIDKLPSISGISVTEYELNKAMDIQSEEQTEILKTMLKAFESTNLTESITYISIDDLTAIKFNYDNRIEVLCGSQLQLERKIRMFTEALKTTTITENSMGTMDFSVPGQAVYDP